MDALLSVCERAITVPIRDLRPYYSRAARNRVMDRLRHGGRERPCEEVPELKQECWTDVPELTQGEQRWFDEAMCRVSNDQRDVIERWSQGGSWEDIGRDLGMTAAKAANTFHSAIRKLRRHVDARRCEAPARPSRSPLWGSTPPSGFGLSGD